MTFDWSYRNSFLCMTEYVFYRGHNAKYQQEKIKKNVTAVKFTSWLSPEICSQQAYE